MAHTKKYVEANRDKINETRRDKYSSEQRKAEYQLKREEILRKGKEERAICPLCGLDFRRLYIPKHVVTRHKMSRNNILALSCTE